ncbi:MAG TPA: helicase-associated domain-containing protein [Ktedonobacterales bacterium]|nr:helicase-associated domain-containing protein [Ktedonobacterales bacterium]
MKSLSAILAGESHATLRALASWWGAEAPDNDDTETRQRLERAMRDTIASRFVWERLDQDERRVLFAVVGPSARNWCLLEQLAERARLDTARTEAALQRLIAHHLVLTEIAKVQGGDLVGQRATFYGYAIPRNPQAQIEEKPIAYVPTELATVLYGTGREIFVPIADRSDKTLDELLMPYRQGDLDQIGRRFGLTLQAYYSRTEVRAAMAENLAQAEAVRYALARIEPRLGSLYDWLCERNGRASMREVRRFLRADGADLATAIHTLEDYALAFDTFTEEERILFIPKETLANLRRAEVRQHPHAGLAERDAPRAVQPQDTTFLWDMAVVAWAAHHTEIELTRSGSLPKRAAQRLAQSLVGLRVRHNEDDVLGYVDLLKQEAADLGLVVAPPSTSKLKGRLGPGLKLDSWARHDQVMQARRLFRRWPTDRWWSDLPGANFQEWMTFYLDIPVAREAVQKLLRECQPNTWYSLASFRATLQSDNPYVLRPSQRYAGEAGFKLADDLRSQWEHTDGELITGIFRSTLYELGLVALGYDRETVPAPSDNVNPDAFLLTDLGWEVLTSELSASQQPSSRAMVVQPNFQVLLMEPHMPALYWLVRYASLDSIGRVSRFTLTREALGRGLRTGGNIDDILSFLERHCQKALPQNVAYTLRDWVRQCKEAEQPKVTLLEVNDEALAGELVTSPKLRAFQLRRVGPRKVAVPPGTSLHDLRRALERLGYAQKLLSGFEDLVAAATTRRRTTRARPRATASTAPIVKGA